MPLRFDDIDAMLTALPDVTVGAKWNQRTWMVNGHGFAWERPFSKADLRRFGDQTPPAGEVLAVRVEDLDAKDALLAMGLPGFFTIEHFNGYAAVLIALQAARVKDVRSALLEAHRFMAAKPAAKAKPAKAAAKPTAVKAKPKPKPKSV